MSTTKCSYVGISSEIWRISTPIHASSNSFTTITIATASSDSERRLRYILIAFSAEPSVVAELEKNFNVMENILKYMVVRLGGAQVEAYRKQAAAKRAAEEAERAAAEAPAPEEAEAAAEGDAGTAPAE